MRLICLGPAPPPYSGTTVSYALLLQDLGVADQVQKVDSLNLQASKSASTLSKLVHSLVLTLVVWRRLFGADLVLLNASNARAIVAGFLLDSVCVLHRKPLVIRVFGGAFMEHLETAPGWRRWMAKRLLRRRLLLLQTHHSLGQVRDAYPDAMLEWFPNSRPVGQCSATLSLGRLEKGMPLRFFFAGNICRDKGIDVLLDIAERYRGKRFELHLFGELQDGYTCNQLDNASSQACRVIYQGVSPSTELIKKLHQYHALLFPTRFVGEGYPGVVLEALAHGIPVIASDWYAIPELIDETCGLLLPHDDPDTWIQVIEKFAENPASLKSLSNGALARSREFDSAFWNRQRLPEILGTQIEGGAQT